MSRSGFDFNLKTFLLLLKDVVKFITYPIRKPLIGIPILLIMFILPTFQGVRPGEVPNWYWQKLNPVKKVVSNFGSAVNKYSKPIQQQFGNMVKVTSDVLGTNKGIDASGEPNIKSLAEPRNLKEEELEIGETRRRAFGDGEIISDYEYEEDDDNYEEYLGPLESVDKEDFGLKYVTNSESLKGIPQIINANELKINDTRIFLHGIYVDPESRLGKQAAVFLAATINKEEINCEVRAYTGDDIPTAICFIGDINLNEALVNSGFSEKVIND